MMRKRIRQGVYLLAGIVWVIGMSAGLIFAYDLVTQTGYFAAHRIDVVGHHRLSRQEVLKQAGLRPGVNIFSVNLFLIRKRLQAHAWVASVKMVRQVPNRLTIHISEHVPLARIDLGRIFILNTKGEIFTEESGAGRLRLPVVNGLAYSDIHSPGYSGKDPFRAVMTVLTLGRKPGSVLSNRRVRTIQVDRQLGVSLYTFDNSAAIKLGYSDYPQKYRRLEKILAFCRKKERFKQLRFIDVNNANRIVVHPACAGTSDDAQREA